LPVWAKADMTELVSVLLATRNRAESLSKALASIQKQTHPNLEILVLDDASSDATPALLARISAADPRLRVLRNEVSSGLANALNRLINESRGVYLARMDDDDWAYPQRIERQLAHMRAEQLDVCGTWYRRVAGIRRSYMRPAVSHEAICAELLFQPPLLHPSVVLRKAAIDRCGGYREDYPHAEDYELWTRLAPQCRFGNVPEILMDYTLSSRQVSNRHNDAQTRSAARIRGEYLMHLGIPCTEAEREVHALLRSPRPIDELAELEAAGMWLTRLSGYFSPNLAEVFARQWFLCAVRAAGVGPAAFDAWSASGLAKGVPARKEAMLWGLCKMRLRYRSAPYRVLEPIAGS
jgi:glycosyltransferase involved in cell wall biosynthesis